MSSHGVLLLFWKSVRNNKVCAFLCAFFQCEPDVKVLFEDILYNVELIHMAVFLHREPRMLRSQDDLRSEFLAVHVHTMTDGQGRTLWIHGSDVKADPTLLLALCQEERTMKIRCENIRNQLMVRRMDLWFNLEFRVLYVLDDLMIMDTTILRDRIGDVVVCHFLFGLNL